MAHLSSHGYRVPEVFEATGPDILMERIEGPTMVDAFAKQPWKLPRFAAQLAQLIEELGTIPLPSHALPERVVPGPALLHLDLHPLNVMITTRGPVVIDWTGACSGAPGMDAANTWLTVGAGQVEGSALERMLIGVGRRALLWRLLPAIDTELARPQLEAALAYRRSDPNLSDAEIATMESIVAKEG